VSYQQIVDGVIADLARQGRPVDATTRQRISTPQGLLDFMRGSAERYQVAANSFNARAQRGAITQSDLDMMRKGLDSLYASHMALYRLFQNNVPAEVLSAAGIEPPVRQSIAAPAGSGLRGIPAIPIAAGAAVGAEVASATVTLIAWIVGVVGTVLTSEIFLGVLAVSAVSYVIYTAIVTDADNTRIEQNAESRNTTFDRCLQAGGTIDECLQTANDLNPPPPSAAGEQTLSDKLLDFGKVALGIGALGIGAYFAVNLLGGSAGGGRDIVVINADGSGSRGGGTSTVGGGGISPGLVVGGVLVGAVGYLWWQARGTTPAPARRPAARTPAVAPTGNLRTQLYGRGEFSRDTAQSLSYDQFVGRRGPAYNLEVGR